MIQATSIVSAPIANQAAKQHLSQSNAFAPLESHKGSKETGRKMVKKSERIRRLNKS
jgi:hypothetical protein